MDINQCNSAWTVAHSCDKQPDDSPVPISAVDVTRTLSNQLARIASIMDSSAYQQQIGQIAVAMEILVQRMQQVMASINISVLESIQQNILDVAQAILSSPLLQEMEQTITLESEDPSIETNPYHLETTSQETVQAVASITGKTSSKLSLNSSVMQFWVGIILQIILALLSPYLPNPTEQRKLEIEERRLVIEEERLSVEKDLVDTLDHIGELFEGFDDTTQSGIDVFEEIVIAGHGLVQVLEIADDPAFKLAELETSPTQNSQSENEQTNGDL